MVYAIFCHEFPLFKEYLKILKKNKLHQTDF